MERARRLRKGKEFDTVYKEGTVIGGPLLVLRVHANEAGGSSRWGFAVGKRISKKAVTRNLIKRRLREAARVLPVRGGCDIVVTARNGTFDASFNQLQAALERSLRRANVWQDIEPA